MKRLVELREINIVGMAELYYHLPNDLEMVFDGAVMLEPNLYTIDLGNRTVRLKHPPQSTVSALVSLKDAVEMC